MFLKNEVVEAAPVFLIEEEFKLLPKGFQHRVFNWGFLTKSSIGIALAMGYGSIYNHSDYPNLRYEADAATNIIRYIAKREIDPDEQLTIHYDQADGEHKPVGEDWFHHKTIEKQTI
jgi:hypothetical protein